jgi:hypothetical protein
MGTAHPESDWIASLADPAVAIAASIAILSTGFFRRGCVAAQKAAVRSTEM